MKNIWLFIFSIVFLTKLSSQTVNKLGSENVIQPDNKISVKQFPIVNFSFCYNDPVYKRNAQYISMSERRDCRYIDDIERQSGGGIYFLSAFQKRYQSNNHSYIIYFEIYNRRNKIRKNCNSATTGKNCPLTVVLAFNAEPLANLLYLLN